MKKKEITVHHYNPKTNALEPRAYIVPNPDGATVLEALHYIYEGPDPELAYRYGCRYRRCGLCGVMVDGKPRLACKEKLQTVNEIAPLTGLPLLRSLVVDRTSYMERLSKLYLFPRGEEDEPLGTLWEHPLHSNLMNCVECLCCVSSCPVCVVDDDFAGPYAFVKLAQLHLDSRDQADRKAQAAELGISACRDCRRCRCPNGIKLHQAIMILSE